MARYRRWLAAAIGIIAVAATVSPIQVAQASASAETADQKMFVYFRTWRDFAKDPAVNKTRMSDLPAEVDVAIVFPWDTPPDNPFWTALRDDYVPALHARGTKLVYTYGIDGLLDRAYPNTAQGYSDLADRLLGDSVVKYGLDGIDVDIERDLAGEDLQRATGVFKALRAKLTGKLLILDTNQDGSNSLFRNVHGDIDYLLEQSYGRSVSGLQSTWDTYRPYIAADKYLIGFSFYEENGAYWGDVIPPFETSRAYQFAQWQPSGAIKGGLFEYAVDRDGIAQGDNALRPTTYSWTKDLKRAMVGTTPPPTGCAATNGADVAIPDRATAESTVTLSNCPGSASATASVEVHIQHTYIGDLVVSLVAPDGSIYVLQNRSGGSTDNIDKTYAVNLSVELANGTWKLRVRDAARTDVGKIDTWTLRL
ncbi:EndoS/ChiA family endoglycosidase [Actinokineospora sp. HUAS TT18]|uniref:EndoS/ChiA family endoglycosidase n=1 Tax=Actinokineospora sp. HUAS TT18 TaxID=3447451 RepID=UPI003F51B719